MSTSADGADGRCAVAGFVLTPRGYDDPDVVQMVADVQAEYVELYGAPDEAAVDPADFRTPTGLFLVGVLDGDPVAMGAWRRHEEHGPGPGELGAGPGELDTVAEVKRMYVARRARRRGLARLLLAELERTAAEAGITRLILNTGDKQPEAIALYRARGYVDVPPYGHYAAYDDAVFLGKSLT